MGARYYIPKDDRGAPYSHAAWADSVRLQETAVFTSLYTGEVLLRFGERHHDFMSASPNQRRCGPICYPVLISAVLVHSVMLA